jgi:hypothetical protein
MGRGRNSTLAPPTVGGATGRRSVFTVQHSEVATYLANSAYPHSVTHETTGDAIASMRRQGIRLNRCNPGSLVTGLWTGRAQIYSSHPENVAMFAVDCRNPLVVWEDRMDMIPPAGETGLMEALNELYYRGLVDANLPSGLATRQALLNQGYDAVVVHGTYQGPDYLIALRSEQIRMIVD